MLCPGRLTGDAAVGTSVFVFPTARVCVCASLLGVFVSWSVCVCVCVDGKSNKI